MTKTAAIFREYLKEVKDLSYLVENENEDILNEVLGYLANLSILLLGAAPKESGISLVPTKAASKRKSFSSFALPLRKKKDRNIGRYGEAAQLSKKYRNVKVDLHKIARANPIETETVALEDPLPEKKQQEVFELSNEEEKEELQFQRNLEANKLRDEEIKPINGNGMLTDLTIVKCQKILKNQFHHTQYGLQDTVLGQILMFKEQKGQFGQILDNGGYHLVVKSNINCSKDEINYHDSLFHGKIMDHLKMQICNISKCSGKELTVNMKACQQQTNGADCGVFAVGKLFHILTSADMGKTKIRVDKMRDHLLQCIKSGHFKESEKSDSSDIVFCKIKKIKIQIFCYCRFPWAWYHSKNKDLDMACCDSCKEWYHRKCENIPDIVFDEESDIQWDCFSCLNFN